MCDATTAAAAQHLVGLLMPLLTGSEEGCASVQLPKPAVPSTNTCKAILSAIQDFVSTLIPQSPIFAAFHNGQVHDPLGGGSYAFRNDVFGAVLSALVHDETLSSVGSHAGKMMDDEMDPKNGPAAQGGGSSIGHGVRLPTRPVVVHAGLQPNNSPHVGTLVVFCYAFAAARGIRDGMQAMAAGTASTPPPVSVEITFVDTAPVEGQGAEMGGVQYQRSHRDVPGALDAAMADYEEVLHLLSTWSTIPFRVAFQSDFFSHPAVPSVLHYMVSHHELLGRQLSPEYGTLALRAACPVPDCGLAEKHGRRNQYTENSHTHSKDKSSSAATRDATITFHCPLHGPHHISISKPADVARLEANAPTRNLIRSMSHLLDTRAHHVRVTGADYAGMYQEVFLYRPLAAWAAATGRAAGRTPHILYAPLIVDWSGAKLSKALYVRERGYEAMELFGTDGLCGFARLRSCFGGDGAEGLRRIWEELEGWVADPRKLFRAYSVEYLRRVILDKKEWEK